MILALSVNMDTAVSAFVALLALFGLGQFVEAFKAWRTKRRAAQDEEDTSFDPETYEPQLPPLSEMAVLDGKVYHLLTDKIEHDPFRGDKSEAYTKQVIRRMIIDEIAFRVRCEALNPDPSRLRSTPSGSSAKEAFDEAFQKQEELDAKRRSKVEAVKQLLQEHEIPAEWLVRNGSFKAKLPELPPLQLPKTLNPAINMGDIMRARAAATRVDSYDVLMTYKYHQFGNALSCESIEDMDDRDLELLIQFKDKLIELYRSSSTA